MEPEAPLNPADQIKASLARIDRLVGLERAKDEIDGLIAEAVDDSRQMEAGNEIPERTRNMVFLGNPGTGKTTVAREIGTLYHSLGLVDRPDVVELGAEDFKGQFQGDTPKQTRDLLMKHKGGVIFIDEAYDLVNGESDDYGKQALAQIVKFTEDHRNDTVVIMAGYPKEMKQLFKVNSGLTSRFPTTVHFDDYDREAIGSVAGKMVKDMNRVLQPDAKKALTAALDTAHDAGTDGNARDVRNLMQKIERARKQRVTQIDDADLKPTDLITITADDVKDGTMKYLAGKQALAGPTAKPAQGRKVRQG